MVTDRPPVEGDEFSETYGVLRDLARRALSAERGAHTFSPTDLVHEAYLRLGPEGTGTFAGRAHFLAVAAAAMRHILVDHARSRGSQKRGGGWVGVDLDQAFDLADVDNSRVLVIDDLIEKLGVLDRNAASIVQMRYFAGMTDDEIGEEMCRSSRWVRKQWEFARLWLREQIGSRTDVD